MKEKTKNKLNILVIFLVTFIVLFFSLKDDFSQILSQIFTINIWFLILAILIILGYFYLRTVVMYDFITKFKSDYSFFKALGLTFKMQFFNGITPFSSGGQPFQVYELTKEGIKVSNATNIIIQEFIVYQIALVMLGLISVISNHFFHFFNEASLLKNLVTIGFIVNISVTFLLFILAFTVKLNKKIGDLVISLLKFLRIVKDEEIAISKWEEYVENFHNGAIILLQNKGLFIKGILYNFVALCALYLIPLVLLYGVGIFNSMTSIEAIITSAYVMLIGSFVPIPGGTGGLEYGFISFYGNYIKGPILKSIMLLWRFITYYLGMIIGAVVINIKDKEK